MSCTAPSQPQIIRQRSPTARRVTAEAPAKASVWRVSSSSDSRVTSGAAPARSSARSASQPASKPGASQPSYREASGRGCTRSVAAVIAPSTPSDPATSCRRAGPAALAGASRVESSPSGVAQRTAMRLSSIRPRPVEAWPDERVATQPPTLAHS